MQTCVFPRGFNARRPKDTVKWKFLITLCVLVNKAARRRWPSREFPRILKWRRSRVRLARWRHFCKCARSQGKRCRNGKKRLQAGRNAQPLHDPLHQAASMYRTCVGILLYCQLCQCVIRYLSTFSSKPTEKSLIVVRKHLVGCMAAHSDQCMSLK